MIKEQPFLSSCEKWCINVAAMDISFKPNPRLQRLVERAVEDTGISQKVLCEDSLKSAHQIIILLASRDPIFVGLCDHLPDVSLNREGDDFSDGESRSTGSSME